jgi:NAD(P)-dependent dehydrogenase (short-subunit alcohol dehydrogenase family)
MHHTTLALGAAPASAWPSRGCSPARAPRSARQVCGCPSHATSPCITVNPPAGRNEDALRALAAETGCCYVVGDLTEEGSCERIVGSAVEQLGGLTTLVNNAGILRGGAFGAGEGMTTSMQVFDANFRANTRAPYEMMMNAIPHLIEVCDHTDL